MVAPALDAVTMSVVADYRTIAAKPTRYGGVLMRSRTEAHAAKALDELRIPWIYEPRTYSAPGAEGYIPDFRLWPDARHPWFLEIKPPVIFSSRNADGRDLVKARDKMLTIRHTHRDAVLIMWLVDTRKATLGSLLVNVPRGRWTERDALPFLATAGRTMHRAVYSPPLWRRVLGLSRR